METRLLNLTFLFPEIRIKLLCFQHCRGKNTSDFRIVLLTKLKFKEKVFFL